jgi:ribosomal protein S12 methylthiotransferase
VLVEEVSSEGASGRAAHQGPDDGSTLIVNCMQPVGSYVRALVVDTDGVDLIAEASA